MRLGFTQLMLAVAVVPWPSASAEGILASFRMGQAEFVDELVHEHATEDSFTKEIWQKTRQVVVSRRLTELGPTRSERQPGESYKEWAQVVFTPGELADPEGSGPEAVYGDDGITNLMKYALGLDPRETATADVWPETGQLDEHWFLWFRRPSDTDDVAYRVEVSTDGGMNWASTGVTQEPILANDLAQSWQAQYHAAAGESVRLRLVVKLR